MKWCTIRKLFAFILALLMLVALTGCEMDLFQEQSSRSERRRKRKDRDRDQSQTTEILEESQPTESLELQEDSELLVSDAFTEKLDDGYTDCYHIPQIHHDSREIAALNKEIYDQFYDLIQETVYDCMAEYDYAATISVQYIWGMKGDYLSVVIETLDTMTSYNSMYVYTVNLDTGKEVSEKEVLRAFGLSEDEYYAKARATMERYWCQDNIGMIEFCGEEEYAQLVELSLSDQNVRATIPYINSDGDLCFIGRVYSPAAADYYPHLFNATKNEHIGFVSCTMSEHNG